MFGKKLINGLTLALAVLLALQALLAVVLFVWSYFGAAQLGPEVGKVITTLAGLGQVAFVYVVVATCRHLYAGAKK